MTTSRGDFASALRRVRREIEKLRRSTKKPRMVSGARRHTSASARTTTEAFTPPRAAEVAEEPVFAPAQAVVDQPVPLPPVDANWKSQCTAVDAATGRRCCLLMGHTIEHRTERGAFRGVAQPGQTSFAHRDALDRHALAEGRGESMYERKSEAQEVRERRKRRAHYGAETTTGDEVNQQRREVAP